AVPTGTVRITGLLGQYDDTYQIQPRSASDLAPAPCFYFEQKPSPTLIQTTGFQWKWRTNINATCRLLYGPSPALGQVAILSGNGPDFSHTLSGLQPGTVYWMQVEAERDGQKILSPKCAFSTQSASSGQTKVYFNHPVQETSLGSLKPQGQSFEELLAETLTRINAAQKTIDVAMYNVNRNDIVAALKAAQQRGVRVRYIGSAKAENTALQGQTTFGVLMGNARELMHNKFMVIDADLADRCWVMGGSTNWTTGNMTTDCNNTVFVQDQSLARAYTLEFEEMYGSSAALPDPARATFGAAKSDNTPHHFLIGGKNAECYFSPSDRLTDHVVQVIGDAQSEAQFALFFFTAPQPAQGLVQIRTSGAKVRGIIDDIGTGSEYNYLNGNGIQVQHHSAPDLFHHKYIVTDASQPQSDPTLLTGSFNWTLTADTQNDENIFIFHDADLATLFKAEFEARWKETSVSSAAASEPQELRLVPNPADNEVLVVGPTSGQITLMDLNGKEWAFEVVHNSGTTRLRLEQVPSGQYFIHVKRKDAPAVTLPFQKI
ncbi:MAG TPA: phospholipase D-like domain-containing protein, partial [Saprospiraceae bacterium]|nr:phospholipase D-like domain-containing protein [Saprospiraceae bacterium]